MAECKYCGLEMTEANGCCESLMIGNTLRKRIAVGAPGDMYEGMKDGQRCTDCGATKGHYHHFGCDVETCPCCDDQLFFCSCEKEFVN